MRLQAPGRQRGTQTSLGEKRLPLGIAAPPPLLSQLGVPCDGPGRGVHVCGQDKTASFCGFQSCRCCLRWT